MLLYFSSYQQKIISNPVHFEPPEILKWSYPCRSFVLSASYSPLPFGHGIHYALNTLTSLSQFFLVVHEPVGSIQQVHDRTRGQWVIKLDSNANRELEFSAPVRVMF